MKTFEATGKTYEEALMAGLAQMGLPSEKVDVEVLEEGTKGFLGIGAKPYKLLLTKKDTPAIRAEEFLKNVTELMGLTVTFEITETEEALLINMQGDNQGILIGHRGHPEVEGVLGRTGGGRVLVVENEADIAALPDCPDARRISRLAQTTLNCESVERLTEALRQRYPALECGPGICYATTNRQAAVRELAAQCGMVLIIGSRRSSNSNRLREIAASCGCRAFLIDGPEALPPEVAGWQGAIGVSAGASAPEELVERTVARLAKLGFGPVRLHGTPEQKLEFAPPEIPEPGTV